MAGSVDRTTRQQGKWTLDHASPIRRRADRISRLARLRIVTDDELMGLALAETAATIEHGDVPAAWLQATVFVLDSGTLELRTADGTVILSAERA